MGSGIADFGVGALLEALFGITPITSVWVALCSDEPGVAADGDILADLEPAAAEYIRQEIAFDGSHWAVDGNNATNLVEVTFPAAVSDWGSINHYAFTTGSTSGDLYGFGELTEPQVVSAGYQMALPPGGLIITLASQDSSITV